jgi:thiamine-phosphate pyrophosphorylase
MDATLLKTSELIFAAMLAESGIKLIQYRDKQASPRRLFEVSSQLASTLKESACRVVVNDRADIAALVNAGGVHVGQDDLPVECARTVCGLEKLVGVSTHNLEQVREADRSPADYVAVGPIFATSTKEKPDPVVGVDFIAEARRATTKPIVAIGGITLWGAEEVFRAGADSVAVASDILCAADPVGRAREYMNLAARVGGPGN